MFTQLKRFLPSSSKQLPIPLLLATLTFLLVTVAYLSFDHPFSSSLLSLDDERAQLELRNDLLLPKFLSEQGGKTDLFGSDGRFREDRETKWLGGIPGWSSFENLYFMGGRFVAVTSNFSSIPPWNTLLTEIPLDVFSPQEASKTWYDERDVSESRRISELRGGTIFMAKSGWGGTTYYYHFVAEVFAGLMYLFTSTSDRFVFPRRLINSGDQWKGFHGGLNEWFMESLAPKTQMQDVEIWTEMGESGELFVFDEISIFDRWRAHEHNEEAKLWNKAMGGLYDILPPREHWWEPVRSQLQGSLALKKSIPSPSQTGETDLPKVVYVSRQPSWHRKLVQEDHEILVSTLESTPGIDFVLAEFENMTPAEQISLALQTDIMIGVHGSGLTHEVWMRNGSSLIEIFDSQSFIRDYQMVAAPLGFNYFPIHNDTIYDWKKEAKALELGPEFSGSSIRVYAPTMRDLVLELAASL